MISTSDRWNMDVDEKEYTTTRVRSLDQVHAMFILSLGDIVLDELHLLLRIGDILIRNLIFHADSCDQRNRAHRGAETTHIRELEAILWSAFQLALIKKQDWTALTRKHKLMVLKKLPPKMSTLLPSHLCPVVVKLWYVSL